MTTGDFDYDTSDIDLLAITSSQITPDELEVLQVIHRRFALDNPEWDDRIDAIYVPLPALRQVRSEKNPIVISPGEPLHVREGQVPADWLQNWYIVREKSMALFGPPTKTVIPHIAYEEFVEAVVHYAAEVSAWARYKPDRTGQSYAILTLCRVLYIRKTGRPAPKKQAALWSQQEFPEWSRLIQNALAWRRAWREEHIDHAATRSETRRFVDFVNG